MVGVTDTALPLIYISVGQIWHLNCDVAREVNEGHGEGFVLISSHVPFSSESITGKSYVLVRRVGASLSRRSRSIFQQHSRWKMGQTRQKDGHTDTPR